MALDVKQLFLDKFVVFNEDRYSDNPDALALVQGLTLSDVVIGSVSDVDGEAGKKEVSLTSASRRFTASEQRFFRADFENPLVSTTINPGAPLANAAALADVEVPGLYLYTDNAQTKIAVVYANGTATGDVNSAISALVLSGCNYTLLAGEVAVSGNDVTVDNDYITGTLLAVEAARATFNFPATDYGKLGEPL